MKQEHLPLSLKSFAKINLFLKILKKRKDGFHSLSTLFCRISLADKIKLSGRNDSQIKVECNKSAVPLDETNLCFRAAELLRRECGLKTGLNIKLDKQIPVGAGLGGGSSNAACLLAGLNSYWRLNLSVKRLAALGAKLGSDVAFFIHNIRFAEGSGRGEVIRPLTALSGLKLWFIVVCPKIKVSTPLIYQKFDDFSRLTTSSCNVRMLTSELLKKGKAFNASCLINDLEAVTASHYPVIKQVKKALANIGLDKIMMSGSGSAVFSLCDSYKQAEFLSKKLARQHQNWQVFAVSAV